jgi:hypothetical protein
VLHRLGASELGADLYFGAREDGADPLRRLYGVAPTCTTSAPFVLAPTSGVRSGNSFMEESDEELVPPRG